MFISGVCKYKYFFGERGWKNSYFVGEIWGIQMGKKILSECEKKKAIYIKVKTYAQNNGESGQSFWLCAKKQEIMFKEF